MGTPVFQIGGHHREKEIKNGGIPSAITPSRSAQRAIEVRALLSCGAWFIPYLGGITCNVVEMDLIPNVYQKVGKVCPRALRNDIFWFFRSKTLGINIATYAPVIGIPVQIIEVYLLGQFTLYCAQNLKTFDTVALDAQWQQIENHLMSGAQLLAAIETSIGKPIDPTLRDTLAMATDAFSFAYRTAMNVPGLRSAQTAVVNGARRLFDSIHNLLN